MTLSNQRLRFSSRSLAAFAVLWSLPFAHAQTGAESDQSKQTLTGKTALTGDWTQDAPGVQHKITLDGPNFEREVPPRLRASGWQVFER